MKKLLQAIAFLPLMSFAQQQVPNGDFENWHATSTCTTGDSLDNYTSIDEMGYDYLGCVNVVSASTDAQHGNKAIKLAPINAMVDIGFGLIPVVVPPVLFLGQASEQMDDPHGIPFTDTPSKLKGYYKFTKGGDDSLAVLISLFKNGVEIAYGEFYAVNSVSSYTPFELTIGYDQQVRPDSLVIGVLVGEPDNTTANTSTVAYVDNFTFEYGALSTSVYKSADAAKITFANINGELKFSESVSEINVTDLQGKSQTSFNSATNDMPVSMLNNGMYLVTYKYKDNYYSSKFVVE